MHKLNTYKSQLLHLTKEYAHYIPPAALLFGFIIDSLTLRRIDTLFEMVVMLSHLTLVTLGILLMRLTNADNKSVSRAHQLTSAALTILIPYSLGGIFSGLFIFYSKSASGLSSLLFLGILLMVMVGSEYYKSHYLRLTVQVSLWYMAIFSFLIFYVPIILASMGAREFIIAGGVSLVAAGIFLILLAKIVPYEFKFYKYKLISSILAVFVLINTLYFTNVIPPIPLSLKHIGVYYSVEHAQSTYTLQAEPVPWYSTNKLKTHTHYYSQGDAVYVYSSIFAPTKLNTKVAHQWQVYNNDTWYTVSTINFPIVGGRDGGYRGYSFKENIWPGEWRVRVITERGQVVGTIRFNITASDSLPELVEVVM